MPQFLSSAAELAIAHGTPALPLLSQSAPKPPLMAGARLPCRRRHPRLVARPAPSAPARWPRAASAETAAQLLGGRSEWVQAPRHRHPTARCPNGPPTANRPLTRFAGWGKPPCTAPVCGARDGGRGGQRGSPFSHSGIATKAALEYQCHWGRKRIQTAGITSGGQSQRQPSSGKPIC